MDKRLYRLLMVTAVILTLAWIGWMIYDSFVAHSEPGDYAYHAGSNYFADGHYQQALQAYDEALAENPEHLPALRGRAETLIMLDREEEAIAIYNRLIAMEPNNAGHYANRGIAYDHEGEHKKALADYQKSLSLDPEIGNGPGWLTRFLRNQPDRPPGIADRARYLSEQFALPPSERLLQVPEIDQSQRPYKQ